MADFDMWDLAMLCTVTGWLVAESFGVE